MLGTQELVSAVLEFFSPKINLIYLLVVKSQVLPSITMTPLKDLSFAF